MPALPNRPSCKAVDDSVLPKTNLYLFTHDLIRRTLLSTNPRSVLYNCTQPGCNYSKRMAGTQVTSTGNFVKHYNNQHKDIPTSLAEEKQLKKPERAEFFWKYSSGSTSTEHIWKLILYVIVSNNLPLSLVESQSFRTLIEALNLYVSILLIIYYTNKL